MNFYSCYGRQSVGVLFTDEIDSHQYCNHTDTSILTSTENNQLINFQSMAYQ